MIPNRLVNSHYGPMIINAHDRYIGASIEQFGAWAADDIELIRSMIDILLQDKQHVCFYDVGANIGTHTVALGRHFGSRIQIRSFEAQRQIYYMLCGNVALNGLDNVICEHRAVSDQVNHAIEITLPDYTSVNNFGGFELIPPMHSDNQDLIRGHSESVITTTIDSFAECIDFVKLDVEGMEHRVLAGARHTFEQHRPCCMLEVLKTDRSAVETFFRSMDYAIYALREDDWIALPRESDVELDLPEVLQHT